MGLIMNKNFLLSFCLCCVCGVSACSSYSTDADYDNNAPQVIDATIKPSDQCGVNGVSCNDSALINYTKTEADYRAYGERTKRDHLYTQAAAGNNLTATVRPGIDQDIVTEEQSDYSMPDQNDDVDTFGNNDGLFMQTAANDVDSRVGTSQNDGSNSGNSDNSEIGHANSITGPGYEIVCTEECDEFQNMPNEDGDLVTSEFTEESFDIADYVKANGDDEDINFVEYGNETKVAGDIDVSVKDATDDTILTWDAKEGDNVRELLTKWSAKSGWKLLWNTNRNYILSAGVMFKGKFTDVSSALIRAFARARPAPIATYYKGNRVIVVETMENENAY